MFDRTDLKVYAHMHVLILHQWEYFSFLIWQKKKKKSSNVDIKFRHNYDFCSNFTIFAYYRISIHLTA